MAQIWTSESLDMRNFGVWYGVLDSYSSSHITIRAGSLAGTYRGSFSYDAYGNVYGQLQSYTVTEGGTATFRATQMGLDAYTVMSYVNSEDPALYPYALSKADTFDLSGQRDYVLSYAGADVIRANGGNDSLDGGAGDDKLFGGSGADVIYGNNGADRIVGGTGADVLAGGSGADLFVFGSKVEIGTGTERDVVFDFQHGIDHVDLRTMDANTGRTGDQAFSFIGGQSFSGKAGQLRYANGVLQGDVNGDGKADFGLEFQERPTLTTGDLLL